MVDLLNDTAHQHWNCFYSTRQTFLNIEPKTSAEFFVSVLTSSDFTPCPAGGNAESYRIYEAMVLGSVPILQRTLNNGNMHRNYHCQHTYAFVQDLNPPVVWLDDWSQLPAIMDALRRETDEQIYQRRCAGALHCISEAHRLAVVEWYNHFKKEMLRQFIMSLGLLL